MKYISYWVVEIVKNDQIKKCLYAGSRLNAQAYYKNLKNKSNITIAKMESYMVDTVGIIDDNNPLESIINHCEKIYRTAPNNYHCIAKRDTGRRILDYLEFQLRNKYIDNFTLDAIYTFYHSKLNGIQKDNYLLGYDTSNIKIELNADKNKDDKMEIP